MDTRQTMRAYVDRIDQIISKGVALVESSAGAEGFMLTLLASRDAAKEGVDWAAGVTDAPAELVLQFRVTLLSLQLATEDVLRLFPNDPPAGHPAVARLEYLTPTLLLGLRAFLDEEDPPAGRPN